MRTVKKVYKLFIVICFVLYGIAYAGGPVGEIRSLDPSVKRNLHASLVKLGYDIQYDDFSIADAMMRFIYSNRDRLRIQPDKLPRHRLVDVAFCLIIREHYEISEHYELNEMCRPFVRP
jgi:hypothetical protein